MRGSQALGRVRKEGDGSSGKIENKKIKMKTANGC